MKVAIRQVFDSYQAELTQVENSLIDLFKSDVLLIPVIGKHLVQGGGKRLRPLFHLCSAALAGYKGNDHITFAGILEAVHTASLLHDDVVDGADVRRGKPAAHALWGNQVVILVGDFLYSNALKQVVSLKDQRIMETLSAATTRMTQGELLQLQRTGNLDITEADYLKIVSAKTGMLISAACRVAGMLAKCGPQKEEALGQYGLKAGVAFQMADDILDYMAREGEFGKRLGKDLDEGKITLPLIFLLRAVTASEKEELRSIIAGPLTTESLARMVQLLERYRSIEEAFDYAKALVHEAKAVLDAFDPCPAREHMYELADYALSRDK